jgi:hypothetical protein
VTPAERRGVLVELLVELEALADDVAGADRAAAEALAAKLSPSASLSLSRGGAYVVVVARDPDDAAAQWSDVVAALSDGVGPARVDARDEATWAVGDRTAYAAVDGFRVRVGVRS